MRSSISTSAARLRWLVFAAMALLLGVYVAARLRLQIPGVHVEYLVHGMDMMPVARASREASKHSTAPTSPAHSHATSRSKPVKRAVTKTGRRRG